jgi:hypothetical protein
VLDSREAQHWFVGISSKKPIDWRITGRFCAGIIVVNEQNALQWPRRNMTVSNWRQIAFAAGIKN